MSGLVSHYERYLGRIEAGWSDGPSGKLPFQVVRFGKGPLPDSITFATLGFHRLPLPSGATDRHIHQELVMAVPTILRDGPIPGILLDVALEAQTARLAILRGDVIGPRGPIVPGSEMEALYATTPDYFPTGFGTCSEGSIAIAISWLVPISHGEAHFVMDRGWSAFEDLLLETQPNLVDIFRRPMSVGDQPALD